jgi:membrane-bound ClpP family serine protease
MIEIFWGCLIAGALFAVVSFIAGDFFHHGLDGAAHGLGADHLDFLNPTVIASAVTIFGGAGVLLERYTALETGPVITVSAAVSVVLSVILHFVYIRPMRNAENSVGFSITEMVGQVGKITIPIPATGYGEVMIQMGAGNACQVASTGDGESIPAGSQVVVVEIVDNVLIVARFDDEQFSHSGQRHQIQ